MQAVEESLESIRQRERERMDRLLANRRPMTEVEWVAQVKRHAAAGRDSKSAQPFWKRWLRRS